VIWAYLHGLIIPCGCGDNEVIGPRKIVEDALMLAVAFAVAWVAWAARRLS
jgi:hypothetical protein